MPKITPCLWFDGQAEEAATFYVSLFKNSRILGGMPGPGGKALTVRFRLDGQEFVGLNGGPNFKFNEATSWIVNCESQQEVDRFWKRLTANGGQESMCGWLTDRFGVSWQVVPTILPKLLADKDRAKSGRVMEAMLQMKKINIAALKKAASQA
jgi:predicted 3-demethylubiquinone-9 3-methyltransferase (glyoxalase superfamily)